jgi:hypothetical protein
MKDDKLISAIVAKLRAENIKPGLYFGVNAMNCLRECVSPDNLIKCFLENEKTIINLLNNND